MFDINGKALEIQLDFPPSKPKFSSEIRRAPKRTPLNTLEWELSDALKYIPEKYQMILECELIEEYHTYGHIYGYRFCPAENLGGLPIAKYKGNCLEGKILQWLLDKSLSPENALYPYELVAKNGDNSICSNWMQYSLIKKYLQILKEDETLMIASGRPLGIFHTSPSKSRVIIVNEYSKNAPMVTLMPSDVPGVYPYELAIALKRYMYQRLGSSEEPKEELGYIVGHNLLSEGKFQVTAILRTGVPAVIAETEQSVVDSIIEQHPEIEKAETPQDAFNFNEKKSQKTLCIYNGTLETLLAYALKNRVNIDTVLLSALSEKQKNITGQQSLGKLLNQLLDVGTGIIDCGYNSVNLLHTNSCLEMSHNITSIQRIVAPYLYDAGYTPMTWVSTNNTNEENRKILEEIKASIDPYTSNQAFDALKWLRYVENNEPSMSNPTVALNDKTQMLVASKLNDMVRNGEISPVVISNDGDYIKEPLRTLRAEQYEQLKRERDCTEELKFAGNCNGGTTVAGISRDNCYRNTVKSSYIIMLDGSEKADKIVRQTLSWNTFCGLTQKIWNENSSVIANVKAKNKKRSDMHIHLPELNATNDIDNYLK